jgi:hypothetical protein
MKENKTEERIKEINEGRKKERRTENITKQITIMYTCVRVKCKCTLCKYLHVLNGILSEI